jgi:4-amino-4-deoxy-L-arabinose transferase-like glycosyltransferase
MTAESDKPTASLATDLNESSLNSVFFLLTIVLILMGAAVLRVRGSDFGLPFFYNFDEPIFSDRAIAILESGDPSPHWFGHPGTLTIYLLTAAFSLVAGFLVINGDAPSLADAVASYWSDPTPFMLAGRLIAIPFAVGTLLLTYAIAARIGGKWVGLVALIIVAVAPLHVEQSQLVRTDVQMTFWSLACLWFAIGIAETGRPRNYVLAGVMLGLGVATKYPAAILGVAIVVGHILYWGAMSSALKQMRWLLLTAGISVLSAALVAPFLLLEMPTVLEDLQFEARGAHLGPDSKGYLSTAAWYFREGLLPNLTYLGIALSLVGLVLARSSRAVLVLSSFVVAFLLFIPAIGQTWSRWILPALPPLAILAAIGLVGVTDYITGRSPWPVRPAVYLAFIALLVFWPLQRALSGTKTRTLDFTHTQARSWILNNVPEGANIAVERHTAQLPHECYKLFTVEEDNLAPLEAGKRKNAIPIRFLGALADPDQLQRASVEYVLLGPNFRWKRKDPKRYEKDLAVYRRIMTKFELVATFKPKTGKVAGYPVLIYRVPRQVRPDNTRVLGADASSSASCRG